LLTLPITATEPPLSVDADGVIRIGKTRVTLRTLIASHKQGATPEQIAEQFPTLNLADVYLTIGYYLNHQVEGDNYLNEQEQLAAQLRSQSEAKFNSSDLYQRLLARHEECKE
jgi:uncharacterized protein (DUF433 family)